MTYVLRQEENGLARAGFLQIEVRPERTEADVVLLTPALAAPQGHPAIWQKLLSQSTAFRRSTGSTTCRQHLQTSRLPTLCP